MLAFVQISVSDIIVEGSPKGPDLDSFHFMMSIAFLTGMFKNDDTTSKLTRVSPESMLRICMFINVDNLSHRTWFSRIAALAFWPGFAEMTLLS